MPEQITAVASGTESFVHNFTAKSLPRQVPRRTLDSLLDQAGIVRFDFLSMDIELSEPAALRGFDIERFRPRLVCIEAHGETRQAILDYFAAHGYVLVGKILTSRPREPVFQAAELSEARVDQNELDATAVVWGRRVDPGGGVRVSVYLGRDHARAPE